MHQKGYITKLKNLSETANYSYYRLLRAKLAWASNTRPDICCSVTKLAQATEEGLENEKFFLINENNKIFRHLPNDVYFVLNFQKLKKLHYAIDLF